MALQHLGQPLCLLPPTRRADILRNDVFKPFFDVFPERFQNKTNGVTPRRWLAFCNPALRDLITETLGSDAWINDLDRLQARRGLCGAGAWGAVLTQPPGPPPPLLPPPPLALPTGAAQVCGRELVPGQVARGQGPGQAARH